MLATPGHRVGRGRRPSLRTPEVRSATDGELFWLLRNGSLAHGMPSWSRLPAPDDNVAIAVRRLEAGTALAFPDATRVLAHTVLEGHRFAVRPIATGEALLSWGLPFGHALAPIAPGDYVSNQSMLDALAVRRVEGIVLPQQPNFADYLQPFAFDPGAFRPAPPVPPTGRRTLVRRSVAGSSAKISSISSRRRRLELSRRTFARSRY